MTNITNTHFKSQKKSKIDTLLESVREDTWTVLNKKPTDLFRVHNPKKAITIWCKKLRIGNGWEYWCYINQGFKTKYVKANSAREWASEQMKKLGGQQIIKIEARVDDEVDDRSGFEELSSVLSKVKNFMKTWGVGYEIKSLKTEPGATSEVRKIIAQNIEKGDVSTNGLEKDIKSKVQNYKDGKPNIPTWKINRIARSEANDIRQISKLIDYKKQGFKFVKHVATLDGKTGQDSKIFNGSIFEIDWLFENPNFRINLRPNDRCNYVPSRGPQKINPQARVWVRKNKK